MLRFLFLLAVSVVVADRATYHNYQVHRVVPENQEQLQVLKDLEAQPNGVSIFCITAMFVGKSRMLYGVQLLTNQRYLLYSEIHIVFFPIFKEYLPSCPSSNYEYKHCFKK